MAERFLVTGALGCIGAWAVESLAVAGTEVVATDLGTDAHRWRLLDPDLQAAVPLINCDVTDADSFANLVAEQGITHIVHLAALQVPFARAMPMLGARVNVEGMAVVLEAARRHRDHVRGLSFASSIAVYGPASAYPPGPLSHDARPAPTTLYGAYKLADEWMARVYAAEHEVSSIGLRPSVVYGPGRDQGMTSTPTQAMLAAATGRPFHIDWGGMAGYHHARDVAGALISAARAAEGGGPSETFNLPVETLSMEDVVSAICEAVPAARITFEPAPLPFPAEFDGSMARRRLGALHLTPFGQAVAETVATFRAAATEGRLPALL